MSYTCYNCFREKQNNDACPFCGYVPENEEEKYPNALHPGSILNGRYIVGHVLGQGGFGITYIAKDYQTGERVAIKEYLPSEFAGRNGNSVQAFSKDQKENFEYGKEQFLAEAKTLAAFIGDEHIVRIYNFFEENNTAYFAMEYVDGLALDKYMAQQGGRLTVAEANRLLLPLMESLNKVHAKGIVHRDIAPDNIIVTKDGSVKLIDFGAARYSTGEKSRSLDVILKHGFAPMEQYMRRGRQGPYTDVYALGVTYYYAISGKIPPDAVERVEQDNLLLPSTLGIKIRKSTEKVLQKALAVSSSDRYQNMAQFHSAMLETMPEPFSPEACEEPEVIRKWEAQYAKAQKKQAKAKTIADYKNAIQEYEKIKDFRDSSSRISQCEQAISNIEKEEERIQKEKTQEKTTDARRQQSKKRPILIVGIAVLCLALILLTAKLILPRTEQPESKREESSAAVSEPVNENSDSIVQNEEKELKELHEASVGDYVLFGSYEQDNDASNGKEPIEWLVLDVQDNRALLLSRYALDGQPYNTSIDTLATWENCTLRIWLNESFPETAFNEDEERAIIVTRVDNSRSQSERDWENGEENNTDDRAFLLSLHEVKQFFISDSDRICKATAYADAQGINVENNGQCSWWLRTRGVYGGAGKSASAVRSDGSVSRDGYFNNNTIAVRPALWVDMGALGVEQSSVADSDLTDDSSNSASQHEIKDLKEASVGDYVLFGNYEQDNDTSNGKEPIEWLVLDVQDNRALLISRYSLDCQQYNKKNAKGTWESSTLRTWLSGSFLNNAFSGEEQAMIPTVTVSADKNPYSDTSPGNPTKDQIFVLSVIEAEKYFNSNDARNCTLTEYGIAQGVWTSDETYWWWLRSPGNYRDSAAYVGNYGSINYAGYFVDHEYAVRPALWVDLDTLETEEPSAAAEQVRKGGSASQHEIKELKEASVGDYVLFGNYEQDNDLANGKEDIEWQVLAKENNSLLVISRYALDNQLYNTAETSVTWETCSLREWLNKMFLNIAFTEQERTMIPVVTVSAEKNPSYNTDPGNNTEDQVFLLSISEADQYFSTSRDRECSATAYAKAQGSSANAGNGAYWWLRSPGFSYFKNGVADVFNAAIVFNDGSINHNGGHVNLRYGVRPAMWIDLDKVG